MRHLIIIGAARSGTKYLRDTLAASRDVCAVPYDVNYIWRHGNEGRPDDILHPTTCTDGTREYIQSKLERFALAANSRKTGQILVEKTVSNCLRVPFVDAVFPKAKFIHLVRNGLDVIESSYRMWTAPRDFKYLLKKIRYFPLRDARYALWFLARMLRPRSGQSVWGPRYPGIEEDLLERPLIEVCARQWAECVLAATAALEQLDAKRVLTVRYEELVSNVAVLSRICEFAGISDPDVVFAHFQQSVMSDIRDKWRQAWTKAELAAVLRVAGPTLVAAGYELPDIEVIFA